MKEKGKGRGPREKEDTRECVMVDSLCGIPLNRAGLTSTSTCVCVLQLLDNVSFAD